MWPDRRIQDLFGIELPIVQAPMAGPTQAEMVIGAAQAGALGSLPCAMFSPEQVREQYARIRAATDAPINLNFFCHSPPAADPARDAAWRERLSEYYREYGLDPAMPVAPGSRAPFDDTWCALVEELVPRVASFHFGLPEPRLLERVRAVGIKIVASATTAGEARWLEQHGCDAIIAQGAEAGGHRGIFLGDDIATQAGLFALLPRIVDAVNVPVIAAGGIFDARGIVAAFALGAAAAQIGTTYLFCPEAKVPAPHRRALLAGEGDDTAMTNVFTGRAARGIVNRLMREVGPMSSLAPAFPLAGGALAPLRAKCEVEGGDGFMPLWSGQARRPHELSTRELTRKFAEDTLALLAKSSG
ncbi:MAG: NAD(P)H-dependent flavin oxidoreductase [Lysobacter sp.]